MKNITSVGIQIFLISHIVSIRDRSRTKSRARMFRGCQSIEVREASGKNSTNVSREYTFLRNRSRAERQMDPDAVYYD